MPKTTDPSPATNAVTNETIWGKLTPAQQKDLEISQQIWRQQADQDEQERAGLIRQIEHERRKQSF